MSSDSYRFTDRELLQRIERSPGSKAGYKQLVRELGLGGGRERRLLVEQLTRMVAGRQLAQPTKDLWAIPSRQPSQDRSAISFASSAGGDAKPGRERLLSGRLSLHRDGFGFVRPEPQGATTGRPVEDIFIPPNEINGAMQGDLVLVDEDPFNRDGRRSGRIARVLTRRNPTVVGIFHYARPHGRRGVERATEGMRGSFVLPLDERLGGPIEIPDGAELVSASPESAHRTLGDVARQNVTPQAATSPTATPQAEDGDDRALGDEDLSEARWPLEGLAVDVELTSFPQAGRPARGRVIEVLGPPDAFGVDVEIVIRKHHLPHAFPPAVLHEATGRAAYTPASADTEELSRREDFRALPIVTIDGETARDFDDAVLVRPLENGHTELQVHIADVSSYVLPGSALDTEARVRGTSVYFPDRAVPMLPHALSSGMCSLLPHEDRFVLSCVMEIDEAGEIVGYRVAEGLIRSARRMTYTAVQHCLNASPAAAHWNAMLNGSSKAGKTPAAITPEPSAEDLLERERLALEHPELPDAFDRMLRLALLLNAKRVRRGSIDFDLPEPVVQFDPDGNMKAIVRSERGWSHRLIEEFMLSANECVATWLERGSIPSIYRIHEMPDPKRILEFEATAAGFGQSLGLGGLAVRTVTMKSDRREAQRRGARGGDARKPAEHAVPSSIPVTPQMYQKLVRRIAGTPEERILAYLMLRSLKQARYAEKNEGHFALASPSYTHFTSPIRRYPDLIVHRLLREQLRRGADPRGGPVQSTDRQPWQTELDRSRGRGDRAAPATAVDTPKRAASLQQTSTLPLRAVASPRPAAEHPRAVSDREQPTPVHTDRLTQMSRAQRGGREGRAGRIGWGAGTSSDFSGSLDPTRREQPMIPIALTAASQDLAHSIDIPDASLSAAELNDIAVESSQAERRAADAERELIEWKKIKFMTDRIGEDFRAIILSVTKYGFFVELDELFIEGLVPLGSLVGDFYSFRDTDRTICGARTGHVFAIGQRVEVLLDRIDRQQRRLQFALLPGTEPQGSGGGGGLLRSGKSEAKKLRAVEKTQAKAQTKTQTKAKVKLSGKAKTRQLKKR